MYILKNGDLYWDGFQFVDAQAAAKRFPMDAPTSTFKAYLALMFNAIDVRFVKLTTRASRRSDVFAGDDSYQDGGFNQGDW
jgi:hypothetical protein